MYAQAALKSNTLLRNGAYGIVMRGVQKCTRGCSSLRGRKRLPLCCIKLDTATDPACGSGNFLTETYLSLRRLENKALELLIGDQVVFETKEEIHVSIEQFYGIEINDFAVTVAKTALWIAESQMMKETERIIKRPLDFLPLKTNATIVEGNALRIDWEDVVPKAELSYIMGNPPFVGYTFQTKQQKEDLDFATNSAGKNLDYVSGWYFLASRYIQNSDIKAAFVSTNSICQGEQVCSIWKPLYEKHSIHIDFAHTTFRWDSEASIKAHVHCIIVGFSQGENSEKRKLYSTGKFIYADNINPYLNPAPNVFIEKRSKPLCDVPEMCKGSQPTDGGNLILSEEEKNKIISEAPEAEQFIHRYVGAEEFINNSWRYCLWLVSASPSFLRNCKPIRDRIEKVREMRLASTKAATQKWADKPALFTENRQPNSQYIIIPSVSSENRKYIPMGFLEPEIITSNLALIVPDATLYHFGILTSNVHNAWTRVVCGRLKSDYRYSNTLVYNNFPWCDPTPEQKAKIEKTAQDVLDARALYFGGDGRPDCSLADLYDELTMPPELRKAHHANDFAVMEAYGFDKHITESECVAELMRRYRELTEK